MQKLDCMRSGTVFFDPNNALNILKSKIIKFQKSEKNNPMAPAKIEPSTLRACSAMSCGKELPVLCFIYGQNLVMRGNHNFRQSSRIRIPYNSKFPITPSANFTALHFPLQLAHFRRPPGRSHPRIVKDLRDAITVSSQTLRNACADHLELFTPLCVRDALPKGCLPPRGSMDAM